MCFLNMIKNKEQVLATEPIPKKQRSEMDGGWGWVVVFASFMIHVIADGVTYTFGIFYVELLKYFGSSKAATAWVASIMTGTTYCVGPIASGLTNKYGCRAVTIAGSLLASFGLLLSLFATKVETLYVTIGLCTGAGFGLMYLPAIVSVTMYFEKRRAFATGIAVCGSGIGSAMLAPITEYLIEIYGWKGAMIIVSGLILNCCVFGALFRPIKTYATDFTLPIKNFGLLSHSGETKENNLRCELNRTTIQISVTASPLLKHNSNFLNNDCEKPQWQSEISCLQPDTLIRTSPSCHSFCESSLEKSKRLDESFIFNPEIDSKRHSSSSCSVNRIHDDEIPDDYPVEISYEHGRSCSLSPGILLRKDIFYSGSLVNIPQYRANPDRYSTSMSSIPKSLSRRRRNWWAKFFSNEVIDTFHEMMDFALLKNVVFLMFAISNFMTSIGFFVPHIYIKDRVVGLNIATDTEASYLLAIIGITSTLGRVTFGYISDHAFVDRLWLYNASLSICGLATIFSSFGKTYALMAIYCAVFGLSCGTYVSLTSVILVDLLGIEKLTNAFGLLLLFQGVASFLGPPMIGWLYDTTESYDPGFYSAGFFILMSGVMLFFIPCVKRAFETEDNKLRKNNAPDTCCNGNSSANLNHLSYLKCQTLLRNELA